MQVTYVCATTGVNTVGQHDQLPDGWVLPSMDLSMDRPLDVLPCHTVVAFSSGEAAAKYVAKRLGWDKKND